MTILLNLILRIFWVGGWGFLVGRRVRSEPAMLIRIPFYLLGTALAIHSIYAFDISINNAVSIGLLVVLLHGSMLAIPRLIEYTRGWDGDTQASGGMVLTFANCANYGLPVLLFAFGDEGFALGIVFVLISIMMQATKYRRNTELAGTTLFVSTILSLGTITLVLMLVR